jgi:hypothetical protein
MGDKVRQFRQRNFYRVAEKVEQYLAEANVEPKAIPARLLLPLVDSASLEDDETIQELWAQLLASAAQEPEAIPPSYAEMLKQLSPQQARILNAIYQSHLTYRNHVGNRVAPASVWCHEFPEIPCEKVKEALDQFEQLGIIRPEYGLNQEARSIFSSIEDIAAGAISPSGVDEADVGYVMRFTQLGQFFLKACIPESKSFDKTSDRP